MFLCKYLHYSHSIISVHIIYILFDYGIVILYYCIINVYSYIRTKDKVLNNFNANK